MKLNVGVLSLCLAVVLLRCDKDGPTSGAEQGTGSIVVTSSPSAIAISLDHGSTGKVTPDTLRGVASGTHSIELTHPAYADTGVSVTLVKDQTVNVSVTMRSTAEHWTGVYGSGLYGLSFVRDGDGNIRDFTLTTNASGCSGTSVFEVVYSGPDTVASNGTFNFRTPSGSGTDGSWAYVTLTGSFTGTNAVSGSFDRNFGRGLCGGISRGVSWQAKKDCTLKPTDGASKTRFCP